MAPIRVGLAPGRQLTMASYTVNRRGVAHARRLIEANDSTCSTATGGTCSRQPPTRTPTSNATPGTSTARGSSGSREGAGEETRARYAFVCGDFRRLHRSGLIACVYRAAEWRHKQVERAAYRLLQELDAATDGR